MKTILRILNRIPASIFAGRMDMGMDLEAFLRKHPDADEIVPARLNGKEITIRELAEKYLSQMSLTPTAVLLGGMDGEHMGVCATWKFYSMLDKLADAYQHNKERQAKGEFELLRLDVSYQGVLK
ncbi:hypothetical protein KY346_00625 [Candidatus Woesearchaeota archaeon]|nr:hypothetical protein [Candidatus Woesearchaeota archaeon]